MLLTPRIDTFRLSNLWNTDLRFSKTLFYRGARVRLVGDLFNLFNANTELQRVRNAGAPNCRALAQNLSPRILRLGLTVGLWSNSPGPAKLPEISTADRRGDRWSPFSSRHVHGARLPPPDLRIGPP